jgi:hypothetical protein
MDPALAVVHGAPEAGVVAVALAAAALLVDPDERRRAIWGIGALALAAVILVGHIADTDQFRSISGDTVKFTGLAVAGAALIGVLTAEFVRRPGTLAPAAVLALPFRIPVEAAGAAANLLVPLYLVIAAGCLARVWQAFREPANGGRPEGRRRTAPLEWALGAFLVVYALQSLYSRDFDAALEQVVFFLVPFAVLFRLLTDLRWTRRMLLACLGAAAVLALAFAAIGFLEYQQRELLWNPKVIAANQFESYFRVNSVFWDPNVYGRFLMVVMLGVATAMLWSRRTRTAAGCAAVLAVLWAGLVLTFSQSSFAGLLAGLGVLAALRWQPRRVAVAAAVGVAAAVVFVIAFQSTLKIDLGSSSGLSKVTSGRSDLISGGVDLFASRPLAGHGSGAFGRAFRRERKGNQQQAVSASHTLPVTVAAEQGLVGLAAYLAVLAASLVTLFAGGPAPGRGPPSARETAGRGERGPDDDPADSMTAGRAAVAAMYCALLLHTMVYAAFLEDPLSWSLLAIGLAIAPEARLLPARERRAPVAAQPAAA